MPFTLNPECPDGTKNIYPKSLQNVTLLIKYYFDDFTHNQHDCVHYILNEIPLELDQVEFIAKKTAQNYKSFFMQRFNNDNLKNFFKYMWEVFYLEENYWRGSANRLVIMNSLRTVVDPNDYNNCSINKRITPIKVGELFPKNSIFNEEIENEVVEVTLDKFQKEFSLQFKDFGTEFFHSSMKHEKAYKFVFEYRGNNELRFADYESNYFISIEPLLFDTLKSEIYTIGKIISLRIRKFVNRDKIIIMRIENVDVRDDLDYLKNCVQDDESYPSNEEWMQSEFGDEAGTAFWNID